ncbi:MAG: aminoglycoside phosphotransferase family protein [Clostridia bacterium]|nr:aminoglycoside phosphotransferase family protein [Clostridia bacterium]
MNEILSLLKSEYGIVSNAIFPVPGGFSAKATYHAMGADGIEYFVKIYDKSLPTTRFFVERIDAYMPVLAWLSALPALNGRMLTPIPLRHGGAYKAETRDDVCVLFRYVHGEAPGIEGMTNAQTAELAEVLARLHEVGGTVPFETPGLNEDISLPFCDRLLAFLDDPGELSFLVAPHAQMLRGAIGETLRLRDRVRVGHSPLVLCHGDAHGNNVIQSGRLVLADWEDLRRAPPEADLFIYAWHPHGETLLNAYAAARSGYRINLELLHFYVLRRRIEDIWVDIQRLTEEAPNEAEAAKHLGWIQSSIEAIQALYR